MIFNLIKNKNSEKAQSENEDLTKIIALLIHAAKIDENYSMEEEKIIKNALLKIGEKEYDIHNIIKKGREI